MTWGLPVLKGVLATTWNVTREAIGVGSCSVGTDQGSLWSTEGQYLLAGALGVCDSTRIPWDSMGFGLWLQLMHFTYLLTLSEYIK